MDTWKYYDVTHAGHGLLNPSSPARVLELGRVLGLHEGARVLDIACGHAEMLLLWRDAFGCTGVGVDASPYHSERARRRVAERGAEADLHVVHARGEDHRTDERFDVACCLGASWIWGGHAGTLAALRDFVKPGGAIAVGEPYWEQEPPDEYLAIEGLRRDEVLDLDGCRRAGLELGLPLLWMAGSTREEWDRYEMLQSANLDAWARAHPDDPDLPAIAEKRRRHDESYLRWGRRCLGWALWAFRVPD